MSRITRKQKGLSIAKIESFSNAGKWVFQGLILSLALNVALITTLIFNVSKSRSQKTRLSLSTQNAATQKLTSSTNLELVLKNFLDKSSDELIALLDDPTLVEDGFSYRDIALSILYDYQELDLERALLGQSYPIRYFSFSSGENSSTYPLISGLQDDDFKLIATFLKNEKWPQTSLGLYKKLASGISEESLKNAFYLSKEFMQVEALFCSLSLPKEALLTVVMQGPWENLEKFTQNHHDVHEFSNALRIEFLSQYLEHQSDLAAKLILEIDAPFALKKLSDARVVSVLQLTKDARPLVENFALHLAFGNRSNFVREEACRLLYEYAELNVPNPFDYAQAAEFLAQKYQIPNIEVHEEPAPVAQSHSTEVNSELRKLYIVEKGDNLWKIAKKHSVSLGELKEANHLDNDLIKVGMTLLIP